MADYGIKVSDPGRDVSTTDPNLLRFSSGHFLFKTFATGYFTYSLPTVTVDQTLYTANFNVALPYSCVVGGYWSTDNVTWWPCGYRNSPSYNPPLSIDVGASGPGYIRFNILAYIQPAKTLYFRYIIYIDQMGLP